jgi:methanogenic corrinoid protein MtbC1
MRATVDAFLKAGLRDSIKIMIDGGQIDNEVMELSGPDVYGTEAIDTETLSGEWIENK